MEYKHTLQEVRATGRPPEMNVYNTKEDFERANVGIVESRGRHGPCATLPLSRGHHPKLVQELLGHASVAMTLDRYSHVLPGMGDQTAAAVEAALS